MMRKLLWFYIALILSPVHIGATEKPAESSKKISMVRTPGAILSLVPYIGLAVAPEVYFALAAAFGVAALIEYGITKLNNNQSFQCPPCPPPRSPRIDVVPPSRPHYPCPGTHMHRYVMHQNPRTCQCFEDEDPNVECLE